MEQHVSRKQQRYLDAVDELSRQKGGASVSYQELAEKLKVTYGSAITLGERLCARGYLKQLPRAPITVVRVKERAPA
jgi:Mn-dependent DtxR family transcriptional regulator